MSFAARELRHRPPPRLQRRARAQRLRLAHTPAYPRHRRGTATAVTRTGSGLLEVPATRRPAFSASGWRRS